MAEWPFTLLLLTGDRHSQVVACLTSLLWQLPQGAYVELFDNGTNPVLENGMVRGLLELGCAYSGWQVGYRVQPRGTLSEMRTDAVERLSGRDGWVLWTDDDCVWLSGAVAELIEYSGRYRAVAPVVVDLLDRGWPDFTGLERIEYEQGVSAPDRHLYIEGTAPFEVDSFGGIFMCSMGDLSRIVWPRIEMVEDVLGTQQLPGPKFVIPSAEVVHLPHTRGPSRWATMGLPALLKSGRLVYRDPGS